MIVAPDVLGLIGNTPLVRLNRASELTGCEILGKAEFMNVGGSIKDRAALSIIRAARASGALKPGGTIVEGTAGNTGVGLALVGAALGHPVVIVMPRTQSEEKKAAIRSLGARLVEVDAAPFSSPNHFVHYSSRLAAELNDSEAAGAIWANQFDNTANRDAHYHGTGPEIWAQTGGRIDAFVSAVGSGGTLAGVSAYVGRATNPLYALMHESIYVQGEASDWAAARVLAENPDFFPDAAVPLLTGEAVYPWYFEQDPALEPLRELADVVAARTEGWGPLYDVEQLGRNTVPVAAAVYTDDIFVDRGISLATAGAVKNLQVWETADFHHDGIADDGEGIFAQLLRMVRG